MTRFALWDSTDHPRWTDALASYPAVVEAQGIPRLPPLDAWYREELPSAIAARTPMHVTCDELVRLTEWKMTRGVWRAPNLSLVRGNPEPAVLATSAAALEKIPHPTAPISTLVALDGVGPATASAVMAAAHPQIYPFFDEIVAANVHGLGKVAWTLGYYARYAEQLRERAIALGAEWTPVMVERALWAHAGGKTGTAAI